VRSKQNLELSEAEIFLSTRKKKKEGDKTLKC
jgi:hypothetical protein